MAHTFYITLVKLYKNQVLACRSQERMNTPWRRTCRSQEHLEHVMPEGLCFIKRWSLLKRKTVLLSICRFHPRSQLNFILSKYFVTCYQGQCVFKLINNFQLIFFHLGINYQEKCQLLCQPSSAQELGFMSFNSLAIQEPSGLKSRFWTPVIMPSVSLNSKKILCLHLLFQDKWRKLKWKFLLKLLKVIIFARVTIDTITLTEDALFIFLLSGVEKLLAWLGIFIRSQVPLITPPRQPLTEFINNKLIVICILFTDYNCLPIKNLSIKQNKFRWKM